MNTGAPQSGQSGFALLESLIALLMLALATIGSGTAMIHALAGQRAALLRTQAADLATDLAEALRAAPDAESRQDEIGAWHAAVARRLPQAQSQVQPQPPGGFDIQLQWRNGRVPALSELRLALTLSSLPEGT